MIDVSFESLYEMKEFAKGLLGITEVPPIQESPAATKNTEAEKKEPVKEAEVEREEEAAADQEPDTNDKEEVKYTLEEVRAKLGAFSKPKVKAIINSFGVNKLTEIPADKYPEVMKKVGEL